MNLLNVVYRCIDLETSGFRPPEAAICEVAYTDIAPDGTVLGSFETLVNPGHPMPKKAQDVHGISDADLAGAPTIDAVLPKLVGPENVVYVAHNKFFEMLFLPSLSPWLCTFQMAKQLLPGMEGHALQFLREKLELQLNLPEGANPHRAAPDVAVMVALLTQKLLPLSRENWKHVETFDQLNVQMGQPVRLTYCPFGKFRGQRFDELEYGMLKWIVDKSAGGEDCVYTAKEVIKERFSKK